MDVHLEFDLEQLFLGFLDALFFVVLLQAVYWVLYTCYITVPWLDCLAAIVTVLIWLPVTLYNITHQHYQLADINVPELD